MTAKGHAPRKYSLKMLEIEGEYEMVLMGAAEFIGKV
jgi:hypothetical protein